MRTSTTASTGNMRPATLEEIRSAVQMMKEIRGEVPIEWLLVAPDGRAWKGQPEELMRVLFPLHPLMKGLTP